MPVLSILHKLSMPLRQRHVSHYRMELGLLLAPFLVGTAVLIVLPALLTILLAFTEYDAFSPPQWGGFQNFVTIFRREVFWISVRNSLVYVGLSAPLQLGHLRFAAFAAKHMLADLQPYLERSAVITPGDFYAHALDAFRWQGQLLGIARDV